MTTATVSPNEIEHDHGNQYLGGRNIHLDAMRGMAAIVVLCSHIRQVFFVPYRRAGTGLLVNFIYIDHYFARAAVIFFFSLSGYLVGTSVLDSIADGRWRWRNYLLSRLSRLYAVLIPALLLTAVIDWLGRSSPVTRWAYFHDQWAGYTTAQFDTLRNFFGSMFFIQSIRTDYFGSNSPLWSLSYEFWYYMAFPLIALAFARRKNLLWSLLMLAALGYFVGGTVTALFPCWLGGVAVGRLARRLPTIDAVRRRLITVIAIAGLCAVVVANAGHVVNPFVADHLVSVAAMALIWIALSSKCSWRPYAQTSILLSEMSYTLYLTHLPLLILMQRWFFNERYWPADPRHLCLALLPFCIALSYAYGNYLLFEARTSELRNWLKHRWSI